MARISLDPPRTMVLRLGELYSRRKYGAVLDPGRALAHNSRVLRTYWSFERSLGQWERLDGGLKHLAVMAAATKIGCSWCLDFGAWEGDRLGLPMEKIRALPAWRENPAPFSEVELLVMEYAEAMTETPPSVADDLAARLVGHLGEAAFVELTMMVAVENLRSRLNTAFGLTRQGFSDRCTVSPT